ncbi:AraC family transcriptional regulator [Alcaligenes aquatilis]|uniref:AraC family transcriptional regulator n=1 Tax=Alcaligenes aquatilis TaxID=323284 RepID=A0A3G2HVK5_9BURK|nr:helix-turn-helix transcriptional regulator [Alcaligenes aquatilis]AYN20911.1 AraC family transcriptional regulator [Alcaligenes aquatilis]
MPWLEASDPFPDLTGRHVLGIAARLAQHDSGLHQHPWGQILYTHSGCITVTLDQQLCLLPPGRLIWIPALLPHQAQMSEQVDYRSVYLDPAHYPELPPQVQLLAANDLLTAALDRIAQADLNENWDQPPGLHVMLVLLDELQRATDQALFLPLPQDSRLRQIPLDTLPPALNELASYLGASEKTISRLFKRDTGLNYQQWRQQWRLLKAIEQLSTGGRVTRLASDLGFTSDSAFIAFFKEQTGLTPGHFSRQKRYFN